MTAAQWAQVLRAGANALPDPMYQAPNHPAQALRTALAAMAAAADKIAREQA
jgi:hypothetical protein